LLSQPFLSTLALGSLVVVRLGHHRMVHSP
jgi:hypothetical protein